MSKLCNSLPFLTRQHSCQELLGPLPLFFMYNYYTLYSIYLICQSLPEKVPVTTYLNFVVQTCDQKHSVSKQKKKGGGQELICLEILTFHGNEMKILRQSNIYIYIYIKYVYIAYKAKLTEGRRIFLKFMMPYYNRKPQFPIFEMRKQTLKGHQNIYEN